MLILVAASLLLSFRAPSPAHLPQAKKPAPTKPQDPIRKWMDAPVYYMSYHMHFDGSLSSSGNVAGSPASGTVTETRDVDGTITLALHSPGPSLSAQTAIHAGMDPNELSNWGTWQAGGVPPDEPQTDANFLKYGKEFVDGWTGSLNYHSDQHFEEPVSESDQVEHVHVVTTKSGSGQMQNTTIQPTLEIDSKAKKFRARVPFLFSASKPDGSHVEIVTDVDGTVDTKTHDEYLWQSGPDLKNVTDADIYGNLPTSGAISCQQSFPAVADDVPGTLTITVVFSPAKAEQVELIIDPPKEYDDWRPMGGNNEKDPGNSITIAAHLQKVGGGTPKLSKLSKLQFKLKHTSKEPGVCMNWPNDPIAPAPFDFKITSKGNPTLIVDTDEEGAADTAIPENKFDGSVTVTSFDYGATAELEVTAFLTNGVQVQGTVKGTSAKNIFLPKRSKPTSYIALSYLNHYGVKNLPDDDDSENYPVGNGFKGDGLTLYEEYRGFKSGNLWTDCDPTKKELFVVNTIGGDPDTWNGITIYEKASKIKVFRYTRKSQVDRGQVINFNHSARPHVVDQHALFIIDGPLKQGYAHVVEVGPPRLALHVEIPPDYMRFQTVNGITLPYFALSLAHEMLHGSSVNHHGNIDTYKCFQGAMTPTPHWQLYNVEQRTDPATGGSQFVMTTLVSDNVTLKKEDGTLIPPTDNGNMVLWEGVPGGQHSGNNECLMKYDCAKCYKSGNEADVYYWIPDEHAGVIVCDSADGTGVNDPNRTLPIGHPQPRYGQAGLGDCAHQICINDLYQP